MPKLARAAPEIPVINMDEALAYYASNLGFRIAMSMPGGDYAIVERDAVALHLFSDRINPHSPVSVHIFTEGLDALAREFHQGGAHVTQEIVRQPWGTRDFRVTDPNGNLLKFTELTAEHE
jgi:uncharacterized glyoxalase superfamily protein PhnB